MALDYLRAYVKSRVPTTPETPAAARPDEPVALENRVSGEFVHGSAGACFVTTTSRPGGETHGHHRLADLHSIGFERIAAMMRQPDLAYTHVRQAVFLDTETTGLGLGTGTYVFLVGAGYIDGDGFHVRQFFLRDPAEELPFLEALHGFLQRFSVLVTFNGKAFDWPLLESRYVGHRNFRRPPLDDPMHVDLLHPARRVWKRRLESCALSSLERHVLGVHRTEEDVPGWLIPSLYFRYVHTGDARHLGGIFYHNLVDILSLAGLAIHLDRVLEDPLGPWVRESLDLLCLARSCDREGRTEVAVACLEEALRRGVPQEVEGEAIESLAAIYKRDCRWESALPLWDRLIDRGGRHAMPALVERAKYHEHVEREYMEALADVQQALNLLELDGTLSRIVERGELEHRRMRLMDRLLRRRRHGTR